MCIWLHSARSAFSFTCKQSPDRETERASKRKRERGALHQRAAKEECGFSAVKCLKPVWKERESGPALCWAVLFIQWHSFRKVLLMTPVQTHAFRRSRSIPAWKSLGILSAGQPAVQRTPRRSALLICPACCDSPNIINPTQYQYVDPRLHTSSTWMSRLTWPTAWQKPASGYDITTESSRADRTTPNFFLKGHEVKVDKLKHKQWGTIQWHAQGRHAQL